MTTEFDLHTDHWKKQRIVLTGGSFPIPPDCLVCRSFERLFDTEAMPGEVATARERLAVGFRDAHHNPLYAMVDRDEFFVNRLKKAGWPDPQLREVVRLLVIVGPECGYSRTFEAPIQNRK